MIKFVAELTEFIPLQWYEFGQPGNKLNHSLRKVYVLKIIGMRRNMFSTYLQNMIANHACRSH